MVRCCRLAGQASSLPVVWTLCFTLGIALTAHAQSSNNILGLPAVPQQAQQPQTPGSSAVALRPGNAPVQPTEAEIKSAISGNIKLASFYQEGLITVRIATDKTYVGTGPRAQALQAARLVQQGVRLSCGKLCKPAPMPAPTLLANNTLGFDLVLSGYAGVLSTADMVNLLSAKPISPGVKPVVAPVASVTTAASAAAPASVASPEIPAGPASAPGLQPPDSRMPASAPATAR